MNRKLENAELERPSVDDFKQMSKRPIIVVLDNIRSLNNIGSVFRTADAFAVEAIYLCGITAKPPHREINKTALGATESVEWKHFETTLEAMEVLKKNEYTTLSIEQAENSTFLNEYTPKKTEKLAVIFGHEVKGVNQAIINHSSKVIEIPQLGTKHSLNISVSVGVVLWDLSNKIEQG